MKILAIVGSLRKDSLNKLLALLAKDTLKDKAELTILEYSDVPLFNQDLEQTTPESVQSARDAVRQSDGIWFFSPEYNHFFSGVLKNLLDWLSRPVSRTEGQVLLGKPTALSGITPGMSGTGVAQDHLLTLLNILNMKVMTQPRLTIPNGLNQVTDNQLKLDVSAGFLQKQADAFVDFIAKQV
jgi:chromate reductase